MRYVLNIACAPPFVLTPVGEITGLNQAYADNATYIPKIGPRIPVLLTSGAQDTTDPPQAAQNDFAYYRSHCHCEVSQYVLPNTGHLFMAHKSLPAWIQHVVTFLSAHHLDPSVVLPKDIRDERRSAPDARRSTSRQSSSTSSRCTSKSGAASSSGRA